MKNKYKIPLITTLGISLTFFLIILFNSRVKTETTDMFVLPHGTIWFILITAVLSFSLSYILNKYMDSQVVNKNEQEKKHG